MIEIERATARIPCVFLLVRRLDDFLEDWGWVNHLYQGARALASNLNRPPLALRSALTTNVFRVLLWFLRVLICLEGGRLLERLSLTALMIA